MSSSTISPSLRLQISQHTPLLFTPTTHQPFLPLPHPSFPSLLSLTLPHPTDAPHKLHTLNHPTIYPKLQGPPYPYTLADSVAWDAMLLGRWEACLAHWAEGRWKEGMGECPCPVSCLRLAGEGQEQGEGVWVGDLGVFRWRFEEVEEEDLKERERRCEENEKRVVGEEGVVWSFGFFLHPSFHSLAIPTHALRALLTEWFLPPHLLGAKKIRSAAYVGNGASRRVQEKCGMRLVPLPTSSSSSSSPPKPAVEPIEPTTSNLENEGSVTAEDKGEAEDGLTYIHDISESRGGGQQEVWVFEWEEARDGGLEARFL